MRTAWHAAALGLPLMWALASVAGPSREEAAELGQRLTPLGAIRAGSASGSLPAWDGGLCKPPANYRPRNGIGGFPYVDPFADEKPLYSVTSRNMEQYSDVP